VRIHGLLDDASRFIIALEAHHTEREVDMLGMFVRAIAQAWATRCLVPRQRQHLSRRHLVHGLRAHGRVPVARASLRPAGAWKMERFWRTLRQGCLDFLGQVSSLHDINVRLWAFLDEHYHKAPHASLLGRSPARVYETAERPTDRFDERKLREALTVRVRRRVRRDTTLPLEGTDWELDQGFLAGRIGHGGPLPRRHERSSVGRARGKGAASSSRRPCQERPPKTSSAWRGHASTASRPVPFDPPSVLLDRAVGRNPSQQGGDR
jgi:putative transposase